MWIFISISCLIFTAYLALLIFYFRLWKKVPVFNIDPSRVPPPGLKISVIVPARNEEENIRQCLDSLNQQSLPKLNYEVIVVNDHSTDRTAEILHSLNYPEMKFTVIDLEDEMQNSEGSLTAFKKFGIETAVKKATGELIVTTDADCLFNQNWLLAYAQFYTVHQPIFIAAPVKIDAGNNLLEVFQALDFITLQGITAGTVHANIHSMCNGANMAYARKAFWEVDGFRGIDHIPSGDDMLLMYKIYQKYPAGVKYLRCPEGIVHTAAQKTFSGFLHQRIRWASKADGYQDKRIFFALLLVYLANLLFPVLLIAGLFRIDYLFVFLIFLILKTIFEYPFVRSVAAFYHQRSLMIWFPFLQPLHILYTVVVGWLGKFGKYEWKNRPVK